MQCLFLRFPSSAGVDFVGDIAEPLSLYHILSHYRDALTDARETPKILQVKCNPIFLGFFSLIFVGGFLFGWFRAVLMGDNVLDDRSTVCANKRLKYLFKCCLLLDL